MGDDTVHIIGGRDETGATYNVTSWPNVQPTTDRPAADFAAGEPHWDWRHDDPALGADDHLVTRLKDDEAGSPARGILYALPVALLLWIVVAVLAWVGLR